MIQKTKQKLLIIEVRMAMQGKMPQEKGKVNIKILRLKNRKCLETIWSALLEMNAREPVGTK